MLVVAIVLAVGALIATAAAAWRCRLEMLGVAMLLVAGAVAAFVVGITRPAATDPVDPNPGADERIAALGDSYLSGEGARRFFRGTDAPRSNTCHRAPTA